jgi:predicted enzyme related to lactoylglutathione lyase
MEGYPDYFLFQSGEEGHGGGIGTRGEAVASTIRIYITVDKLEDAIAAAEENGGAVTSAPQDVPGQGRFAAVRDSEGTEVGLWETLPEG